MLQVIIVIIIAIVVVWFWSYIKNSSRTNFLETNEQFKNAKDYTLVPGNHILVNDEGYIALKNPHMSDFAVLHINDITDLDVNKNGKFHGSIAGTIGGALTYGLAGSIIGSMIMGTEKIHHFGLVFITNHAEYPAIEIEFLNGKMKHGGIKDSLLTNYIESLLIHLMRLENQYRTTELS